MRLLPLLAAIVLCAGCSAGGGSRTPAESSALPRATALDPSQRDCAPHPSTCGYPDAASTGPAVGATLRRVPTDVQSGDGWHYDPRGWVAIDGDGAQFRGYDVDGSIDVTASGVLIEGSRITVGGETFGISLRSVHDTTIRDTLITAPKSGDRLMVGIKDINGDSTGTLVQACDISQVSTGVQLDTGTIRDCYVHDLARKPGDHLNGTTSNAGTNELTLEHNTVLNRFDQTDAISLFQDFGDQQNRTITNNLVAGGSYTIYGGANPEKLPTANIRITDNRFSRIYFKDAGSEGPVAAYNPDGAGNVFTGNIWDDTGEPVTP